MEKVPQMLSETGSFENIVNTGTQASRRQTAAWVRKSLKAIVICMAVILVTVLLLAFQVIPAIPSVYVLVVLTCSIGFISGRIYEKIYK
jgi:Na+/H+ antiporter NhaC